MDLEALTREEERLIAIVDSQVGGMEEKSAALGRLGVFDAYRAVHEGYALLADREDDLEALKRALFLQWYGVAEPHCFTGLKQIAEPASSRVWLLLEERFEGNRSDGELRWMLATYYAVADYYFDVNSPEQVVAAASGGSPFSDVRTTLTEDQFRGRGAMGNYWISMLGSRA
jgi:hypothetical protein